MRTSESFRSFNPFTIHSSSFTISLRHSREFTEVGLAFFEEGLFAFFAFFAHVVEQCGVASEVEQAHLAIAIGKNPAAVIKVPVSIGKAVAL